ncbi:MAG: GspE/PulE family protein [Candidatus Brocadiia bacterium]
MAGTTEGNDKNSRGKPGPRVSPVKPSKMLEEVLANAQGETRRQLQDAIEKKKTTGRSLTDILRQDVDRDMFKRIWAFLEKPADEKPGQPASPDARKMKDVLVEGGWMTSDEMSSAGDDAGQYDPAVGRALVESGALTEDQLADALAQHERSGASVWRILVNRGLLAPKQIADARKYGSLKPSSTADDAALAEILVKTGLVTEEQCRKAMAERKATGRDVTQILIDSYVVTRTQLGVALAKEYGVPYADLTQTEIEPAAAALLPEHLCEENRMLPIAVAGDRVTVAMANPNDASARDMLRMMVNKEIVPVLAFDKELLEALKREHARVQAQAPAAAAPASASARSPLTRLKERLRGAAGSMQEMATMAEKMGVIDLVSSIIEGAINSRATDIHLEPQTYGLRVRYRIDGMLYDVMTLPEKLEEEVIARVKVLSNMDVTERRHPQDGHCSIEIGEKTYDMRAATLPTVLGEKLVLRMLSADEVFLGLGELGLEPEQLRAVEAAVARPYGMILVTGPIAAGKTSTLYAALSEIDIFTRNVVTIEDPVEYRLPGINQVEIDHRVDRTFANMLRAVLRQDANVMMVGEIRDEDTAAVAVRAAMTGHMVFSTLHANDAVGAIGALRHLGIPAYLVTSAVHTVAAQRLVRKVCPRCREPYTPDESLLRAAGLDPQEVRRMIFYKAVGCKECYRTGYRGRTGIFEILSMDETIKSMVLAGSGHDEMVKAAREKGMMSLMQAGVKKVQEGAVTLEELLRVTTL